LSERTVAAIILAAGASRRLGQPKQLVQLGSETLLDRAVRVASEAGCAPVLVVLGAEADLIQSRCDLSGAIPVLNDRWAEGMATSIRAALEMFHVEQFKVDGAMLMVCDQPAMTAEHLRVLAATGRITASEYAGRRGVPAYFPASTFTELADLTGDAGARELLRAAEAVPLAGGELDVDTPEALEEARRRFGN
jgi:CTP:molybdopterin cytidylyltransferase MocA